MFQGFLNYKKLAHVRCCDGDGDGDVSPPKLPDFPYLPYSPDILDDDKHSHVHHHIDLKHDTHDNHTH